MNHPNNLLSYSHNITSEHGEDGIIAQIFKIIGEGTKWCVDLGALNGVHGSNVWFLIKERKWKGVLIEADETYFQRLQKEYEGFNEVFCRQAFVSFEGESSLDRILATTPLPNNFDLFSLDVDGNEYHLWDSLHKYRPRVMVVEFNPSIPNEVSFIQPRDMRVFQGSSLRSLVELGKRKGYELIATNDFNAFFVTKELFNKFGIADNSIETLHQNSRYETKLFQLYDGTLQIAGYDQLIWRKIPINVKKLQVLPKRKRYYHAKISEKKWMRKFKYWARRLPIYPLVQKIRGLLKKI